MRFGILGSGMVGRAVTAGLSGQGHDARIGTRDVEALMARQEPDAMGNEPFSAWSDKNPEVKLGTFSDVAAQAEIVVNATAGSGSLEALALAGDSNLGDKVLIDIANPLDFSRGMPPSLLVCNTDSLAEQIQRAYPATKVVKTLNTVTAYMMIDPAQVGDGEHHIFVSGDDAEAKVQVTEILRTFGWKHIIDLGGIATARATEMYMPLWLSLMGALDTPVFNIAIVNDSR